MTCLLTWQHHAGGIRKFVDTLNGVQLYWWHDFYFCLQWCCYYGRLWVFNRKQAQSLTVNMQQVSRSCSSTRQLYPYSPEQNIDDMNQNGNHKVAPRDPEKAEAIAAAKHMSSQRTGLLAPANVRACLYGLMNVVSASGIVSRCYDHAFTGDDANQCRDQKHVFVHSLLRHAEASTASLYH